MAKLKEETALPAAVAPAIAGKSFTPPKELAKCADLLYLVKQSRLTLQHKVDRLQAVETQLKDHIIDNLPKSEASGISGKVARVQLDTKSVPRVEDWDKFYTYVRKSKAFDLLQRRINEGAIKERAEAGKPVPGVGSFTVVTVSCTAVK